MELFLKWRGKCVIFRSENVLNHIYICRYPGLYKTSVAYDVPAVLHIPVFGGNRSATGQRRCYFYRIHGNLQQCLKCHSTKLFGKSCWLKWATYTEDEHPKKPDKKFIRKKDVLDKIDRFCEDNIRYLTEVPSVLAERDGSGIPTTSENVASAYYGCPEGSEGEDRYQLKPTSSIT